ncbi:MAG: GGDEF domain-containing protein [Lachnospiraceae bacterium]|nr:GGDEF domain-containing protein [Lachnospiraceae bacterium]
MKKIGFFTTDWNYELVSSMLRGLKKYVDEHEDVRLYAFDCYGRIEDTPANRAEYEIFSLPDFSMFDGVIVEGNQIVKEDERYKIRDKIKEAKIPGISIEYPVEGLYFIGVNNFDAMKKMVDHVIEKHGAKSFVFITGVKGYESDQRQLAFETSCEEHGIDKKDIVIIDGDWQYETGRKVGQLILDDYELPDAIISGNDDMALGVCEIFESEGIDVPGDVIVTGFDNIDSAFLHRPRISTISRDYEKTSYSAIRNLMDIIDNGNPIDDIANEYNLIFSESCGCGRGDEDETELLKDRYFARSKFMKNYYRTQENLAADLFDADDLAGVCDVVEKHSNGFFCDNVFMCINDFYFDNYEKAQWDNKRIGFSDNMILGAVAKGNMKPSVKHVYRRFPKKELLPNEIISRERFMIFYPLHYKANSIGYIAMNDISPTIEMNLLESALSYINIAIENVRKKNVLRNLNGMLDNLYVRDSLTNLYNRFGYDRVGKTIYDRIMAKGMTARILFVDIDDMKKINDECGHESGDEAIKAAAEILIGTCDKNDFIMRYGGDEFLIIGEADSANLKEAIRMGVKSFNSERRRDFSLSLSVGEFRVEPDEKLSLDDCITRADEHMYEEKKEKKIKR